VRAIILGSGFSSIVDRFKILESYDYQDFVDYEIIGLPGHARKLILAEEGKKKFLFLSGKLHIYEGYSQDEIQLFLENVLDMFPIDSLLVTSASGALTEHTIPSKWYLLDKILDFSSMEKLQDTIQLESSKSNFGFPSLETKTYSYQLGPSTGTRAEYAAMQKRGADLVGLSMLAEYLVSKRLSLDAQFISLPVCTYFPLASAEEPSYDKILIHANEGMDELHKHIIDYLRYELWRH